MPLAHTLPSRPPPPPRGFEYLKSSDGKPPELYARGKEKVCGWCLQQEVWLWGFLLAPLRSYFWGQSKIDCASWVWLKRGKGIKRRLLEVWLWVTSLTDSEVKGALEIIQLGLQFNARNSFRVFLRKGHSTFTWKSSVIGDVLLHWHYRRVLRTQMLQPDGLCSNPGAISYWLWHLRHVTQYLCASVSVPVSWR